MNRRTVIILAFGVAALVTGCASSQQKLNAAPKQIKEFPVLKVLADCGKCQVRSSVPELITTSYSNAVKKSGGVVNPAKEASLSIKDYSERNDVVRFMTGVLSGKDEIRAEVNFQGRKIELEEYYRNAWHGIEAVAGKIGGSAFEELNEEKDTSE